jgi:hypothetical protein
LTETPPDDDSIASSHNEIVLHLRTVQYSIPSQWRIIPSRRGAEVVMYLQYMAQYIAPVRYISKYICVYTKKCMMSIAKLDNSAEYFLRHFSVKWTLLKLFYLVITADNKYSTFKFVLLKYTTGPILHPVARSRQKKAIFLSHIFAFPSLSLLLLQRIHVV